MRGKGWLTRRVFIVFRYVPKVQDAVDVVKMFFEKRSKQSRVKWQVDVLAQSLPSGSVLLIGVLEAVKQADLVIVVAGEISNNVAFELGLAYAFEKDIVLLAPKSVVDEIPKTFSDIAGVKCAVYDPERIMKLPDVLKPELDSIDSAHRRRASRAVSPDYLVALGDLLQMEGLYDEAIGKYKAACDLEPRNVRYLLRLGQAHAAVYDLGSAEEVLRQTIAVDDSCALALDSLAQVLLDAGKYQMAIDDCLKPLIAIFPKTEAYYFRIAVAYTELGQPEVAAEFLAEAAAKDIRLPRLFYDLAWTSVRASNKYTGRVQEDWVAKGLAALKEAINLDLAMAQRAAADQDFDVVRTRADFP